MDKPIKTITSNELLFPRISISIFCLVSKILFYIYKLALGIGPIYSSTDVTNGIYNGQCLTKSSNEILLLIDPVGD